MRKPVQNLFLISLAFVLLFNLFFVEETKATTIDLSPTPESTISATPIPTVVVSENITDTKSVKKIEYKTEKWNGFNSFRLIVAESLNRGVSSNTIVLLLLLPLVATLVSVLHYIVGLTGYGIFMPTMIAVTFLATGIFGGLILFALILCISIAGNLFLKKLKIHFWPARSINLMLISIGTFALMLLSSFVQVIDISNISIFPILFMIMLAEEFVRTQLVKSKTEAKKLMLGTLVLSIFGAVTMSFKGIQDFVLYNPELVIVLVIVINLMVGNYTGIRLSEVNRFKKAIRSKSSKLKDKKLKA